MTTIRAATKANQATFLPTILVATYINKSDPDAALIIDLKDVDVLQNGVDSIVRLDIGSNASDYGSENIILKLIETYSILQSKNTDLVSDQYQACLDRHEY